MNAHAAFPPRRRRVLHVNRVAHVGGVERVLLTLAAASPALGWDASLACPGVGELPDAARRAGVEVRAMPIDRTRATLDPRALAAQATTFVRGSAFLAETCRRERIDVIHAHHPVGVLYAARARKETGVGVLFHCHEAGRGHLAYRSALRLAAGRADGFVAVSGPCADLVASAGVPREDVRIVHNGVDPSFAAGPDAAPDPALDGPGPHVGIFGVIEPRKGHDVFLAAAARIAETHPTATFWVVGGLALKDKAGHAARIRAMAEAPALAGRVRFVGYRPDVAAFMRRMDAVVMASVAHESFGMTVVEAMTLGRPVAASVIGGTPEIITDGVDGRLFPIGDAAALAAAVADLLGPAGAAIAENGRRTAESRFTGAAFAASLAGIYDELASSNAGASA